MKKVAYICITLLVLTGLIQKTSALDDGAYLIGCSSSYVNPLTNETEDGGTNIALGDSMVSSIVEKKLLFEQVDGKIYITVGLGLASNVSNVRFQLMDSSGTKKTVSAKVTGSSQANGDTVNHYRIQVSSLNQYISPIMFVDPMGRDVQFFIKLNSNSISSGTGVYTSEMVKKSTSSPSNSTSQTTEKTTETKKNETEKEESTETKKETENDVDKKSSNQTTLTEVSKESLFKDVQGISYHTIQKESQSKKVIYNVIGVIGVVGLVGGIIYAKKRCKTIKK